MPHPFGKGGVDGTDVSRIKDDIDDIERASFQIGMPLPTAQDKYISHTNRERPPAKGHQTRTTVNNDNFPKLVPVAGISRMIGGPNYRKGTGILLG